MWIIHRSVEQIIVSIKIHSSKHFDFNKSKH
jgi:hypothetical protein